MAHKLCLREKVMNRSRDGQVRAMTWIQVRMDKEACELSETFATKIYTKEEPFSVLC